jgi:hypothetical protein
LEETSRVFERVTPDLEKSDGDEAGRESKEKSSTEGV